PSPPPPEAPVAPPHAPPADDVRGAVVAAICEVTGYPPELVQDGAELEADLGVDSIRKMEILGLLQDRLGFRADERDYTLLAHADLASLVEWARARGGGGEAAPAEARLWARALVPVALPDAGEAPPVLVVAPGADLRETLDRMVRRAREAPAPLALLAGDDAVGAAAAAFARCLGREQGQPVRVVHAAPDDPRAPAALAAAE